ncbi:MAG: hypothetical protein AAGE05_02530 [Pseudomonadota bacterium]
MRQAVFVLSIVFFVAVTTAVLQYDPGDAAVLAQTMPEDGETHAERRTKSC